MPPTDARCPRCDVDLDDDGTRVWCWKCGYEVRDVDDPRTYSDVRDEITDREEFRRRLHRR